MNRDPPGDAGPVGSSGRPPGTSVARPPGYVYDPVFLFQEDSAGRLPPGASPQRGDLSGAASPSTPITPPHAMIVRDKPVGTIPRASAQPRFGERPRLSPVPRVHQVQSQPYPKNETTSSLCKENTPSPAAVYNTAPGPPGRSSGPIAARAVGSADPTILLTPLPAGRHLCVAGSVHVLSAHRGWSSFFDKLLTRAVVADAFAVCDARGHRVRWVYRRNDVRLYEADVDVAAPEDFAFDG